MRTLTLRLKENDADLVEWAKDATYERTASKAVIECVKRYKNQAEREAQQKAEQVRRRKRLESRTGQIDEVGIQLSRILAAMARDNREMRAQDREDREGL